MFFEKDDPTVFDPRRAICDFRARSFSMFLAAIIFGNEHSKSIMFFVHSKSYDILGFEVPKWCKNPAEHSKSVMLILVGARVFWPNSAPLSSRSLIVA